MAGFQTNEKELTSYGLKSFVPITGLNNLYLTYENLNIMQKFASSAGKERYFDSEGLSRFNVR